VNAAYQKDLALVLYARLIFWYSGAIHLQAEFARRLPTFGPEGFVEMALVAEVAFVVFFKGS